MTNFVFNQCKHIGGQAVIEGVMMKSDKVWSVAVRNPSGEIELKAEPIKATPKFFKLPIIRGVVALIQALSIGVKAIEYSGNVAYKEEDGKNTPKWQLTLALIVAIVLALGLFKFVPLYITTWLTTAVPELSTNYFLFNLIDGLTRVCIFFIYVIGIGFYKEMARVFEYHGAEHKVIYAYEAGEVLTVQNAKKYKPYHPRCGTSFLLILMVLSIMIFMFIPKSWSFTEKLLARIILIPLIAGVSYEVLKLSAKAKDSFFMQLVALPGMLLQRFTVKEPDDAQIEVAIKALQETLKYEPHCEVTC